MKIPSTHLTQGTPVHPTTVYSDSVQLVFISDIFLASSAQHSFDFKYQGAITTSSEELLSTVRLDHQGQSFRPP